MKIKDFDTEQQFEFFTGKNLCGMPVSNRKTRYSQMLKILYFALLLGRKLSTIGHNLNNNVKLCIDVNSFRNKLRQI